MSSNHSLSQSLARLLLKTLDTTPTEWHEMLSALPAGSWAPDQGSPSLLEALVSKPLSSLVRSEEWVDLLDHLWSYRQHASDQSIPFEKAESWFDQALAVVEGKERDVFLHHLWSLLESSLIEASPEKREAWFMKALEINCPYLAVSILCAPAASPWPVDVSNKNRTNNPFAWVQHDMVLEAMLDAGFDLDQPDGSGATGRAWLLQRTATATFGYIGYASGIERRAMLKRANDWVPKKPPRFDESFLKKNLKSALQSATWTGFRDAFGALLDQHPSAWMTRFDHGKTLLHELAIRNPEWLPSFLKWTKLEKAPDDFFSALDDHGMSSLMARAMDNLPAGLGRWNKAGLKWISENRMQWWGKVKNIPAFQRWCALTPSPATISDVVETWLRAADREGRSINWAHPVVWTLLEKQKGWTLQDLKLALDQDERLQKMVEHFVFERADIQPSVRKEYLDDLMKMVVEQANKPGGWESGATSVWSVTLRVVRLLYRFSGNNEKQNDQDAKALLRSFKREGADLDRVDNWLSRLPPFGPNVVGGVVWPTTRIDVERHVLKSNSRPTRDRASLERDKPRL